MARQSTAPLPYQHSNRVDNMARMTTARAGRVDLIDFIPVLRGDSVGGSAEIQLQLNHMPKPLLNAVIGNVQAWFVPHSALPRFSGWDEFIAAYHKQVIKAHGHVDRNPPALFQPISVAPGQTIHTSTILRTLGVHIGGFGNINNTVFDAYSLVYNFRLEAHSSKLTKRPYYVDNPAVAVEPARAFWPQNRFSRVVPDYERALVMGQMQLDVIAGQLPVSGISAIGVDDDTTGSRLDAGIQQTISGNSRTMITSPEGTTRVGLSFKAYADDTGPVSEIVAEMAGQTVVATLQDIDKARTTQAMAKARSAMAGIDGSGYLGENTILAELMQGLSARDLDYRRPWLLGQQMVTFGMLERHATDSAGLDDSVSIGRAAVRVPLNLPQQDSGGVIIITCEVLPERVYERQGDAWLGVLDSDQLPQADRDVLRPEPVDIVPNWRVDAKHSNPGQVYGFEAMNDKWNREAIALGGAFFQPTPGSTSYNEARAALWVPEIVNPVYNRDHFLAPSPFPHDVFSDTEAHAYQAVVRRSCVIRGLTQIGDVLVEDNSDFEAVSEGN